MADRDKQDRHSNRESPSRTGILSDPKAISDYRRNRADSLDNNKSEQPAGDKVIVALCAQQTPSLRLIELALSVTVLAWR
jgi:hypothetical protein